jgi:hypothetical protein
MIILLILARLLLKRRLPMDERVPTVIGTSAE